MKTPLINQETRYAMRDVPECSISAIGRFTLAWALFKREVGRYFYPKIKGSV